MQIPFCTVAEQVVGFVKVAVPAPAGDTRRSTALAPHASVIKAIAGSRLWFDPMKFTLIHCPYVVTRRRRQDEPFVTTKTTTAGHGHWTVFNGCSELRIQVAPSPSLLKVTPPLGNPKAQRFGSGERHD